MSYTKNQPGAIYAMTNQLTGNAVMAFTRAADGTLTPAGTFPTGGFGNSRAGLVDPLGSQGALILSADNRFLFAVNAASDEISVFAVDEDRLTLIDIVASGGRQPVSLAHREGLLYVLNAGGGIITGFTQGEDGRLTPLDGSTQPVGVGPAVAAAQVGFTLDGSRLVVTEKLSGLIDTYAVDADGRAGPPLQTPSNGTVPFGFVVARDDLLIVVEGRFTEPSGAVSSYRVGTDGKLEVISGSVSSNQAASCWISINDPANPAYVYTSNTGAGSISGYAIGDDGTLSLLDPDGVTATTSDFPIDSAVADGQFLYVMNNGPSTIEGFRIESDGSLTPITEVGGLPGGSQGIAAY